MITIKDIIKAVSLSLSETAVNTYVSATSGTATTDVLNKTNTMVSLCNLVINELATTYIPMTKLESVVPTDNKVYYSDLTEKIIRVKGAYDDSGNAVQYKIHPEYVYSYGNVGLIEYDYCPTAYGLNDNTGYKEENISVSVLACGVCAEYCLTQGRFDEAVMWRQRYSDGVAELCQPKNRLVKGRLWL